MSFSSDVKSEILEGSSKEKKECCIKAEKFGELLTKTPLKENLVQEYKQYLDIAKLNECCIKSILKGAFLGAGCIVEPNIDYHFEILVKNKSCCEYLFNLLSLLEFTPKIMKRKKQKVYTIYFKESDQISIFLSIIGTNKAMLKFEEIRVEKDVSNNVNRTLNCELANLEKTIVSSVKQINAIEKLKKSKHWNSLNDKLKYTSYLRMKYKNDSLEQIASKTKGENKISKSGLKHRLDKIIELAEKIDMKR
ncbi:MAG: DNA-binding protein WhiA [Clostridia bacterium]